MTRKGLIGVLLIGSLAALAACDEREVIFQGTRESIFSPDPEVVGEAQAASWAETDARSNDNVAQAVSLPAQSSLGSWTNVSGNAGHNAPHVAFSSAPQVAFEVPIGKGNTRKYRITAEPMVADGRVFTMDSESTLTAVSTGGAALWSIDLTPASDRKSDASGGGLAYEGGTVFATTGFGELIAVQAGSGQVIWRQALGAASAGAPVVSNGTVYVLNARNVAMAVSAANGRVQWQLPGTPEGAPGELGAATPAVAGNTVVVPFSIGSLVGVSRADGKPTWAVPTKGVRIGKGYNVISEYTGVPVVSGSTIYAGTAAGASIALSTNGQVRWTSGEGAAGPMVLAGNSIFMVGDNRELVRLSAASGDRIWGVPLPGYTKDKVRRRRAIYPSYGPALAGGRLWVASGDGFLRAFNPVDGALVSAVALPAGAASRPVIIGGVAYIVTERGTLLALR